MIKELAISSSMLIIAILCGAVSADGTVKSGIPMSLDEWANWAKK